MTSLLFTEQQNNTFEIGKNVHTCDMLFFSTATQCYSDFASEVQQQHAELSIKAILASYYGLYFSSKYYHASL